jgi:hypothetical protein
MKRLRSLAALAMAFALLSLSASLQAQTTRRRPATRRPATTAVRHRPAAPVARNRQPTPAARSANVLESRLTGVWLLDVTNSDDPRTAAENAASNLAFGNDQPLIEKLMNRLNSPEKLSIERRGNNISMASSRAPRITFDADGREHTEAAADGHQVRTRAALYGAQLMVSSNGSKDDDFNVTFDPIDDGRRLRVTRRIFSQEIGREVVVQSIYNKSAQVARWSVYGEPESERTAMSRSRPQVKTRNPVPQPAPPSTVRRTPQPQPAPPVIERNDEAVTALIIPDGTQFVAVLNNDLSTAQTREGDGFSLTVRAPAQYEGAIIEGRVARIDRSGPFSGRSEMTLDFTQIRLRDGRTAGFTGDVESVRAVGGEDVRVDREGPATVQESDSQTNRTAQRAAIGAAVGSIIGAITGGGKGAAIGAAIGAGVGAGSVYIQGRDDLELKSGTELSVRASRRR